ncbi:hypothetical protein BGZ81_007532 [Podila clonocystis]|nr:hypothetical protein BGZ81_007532 [Podila clonocystis]
MADLDGVFPTGLKMVDCDLGEFCIAILAGLVAALVVICAVANRRQLVLNRIPYILNTEAASLEFRIVGLHFEQGGLNILKVISGSAPAAAVLVVMVDILAGKNKGGKVTGQILLNGKQVHLSEIRRAVGYADQENALPPTRTVCEAVLFSAMMRLPEATPIHRVHERVSEVIEILGLTHCSNRRICNVTTRGISGGEKRRVSIALELITRPPILILDEPTSGLDSHRARMVAEQLWWSSKEMNCTSDVPTQLLINVIAVDLSVPPVTTLRISAGYCYGSGLVHGQELYQQRRKGVGLFWTPTPCLWYTAISRHQGSPFNRASSASEITRISAEFRGQSYETAVPIEGSGSSTLKKQKTVCLTGFLNQLRVIMKRNLQTLVRDKTLLALHLVMSVMIGLNSGIATFFELSLILVLFNISTVLFCLAVAAGVRTMGIVSLASSIVMPFLMLFGGFLINIGQIPRSLTWVRYLSIFRCGFEALAMNEIATSKLIDNIQGWPSMSLAP